MTGVPLVATDALLPIRLIASVALLAVIVTFVHVVRHLREIERRIMKKGLVPAEIGPRNNVVLIICAIPVIVVGLLLFLVIRA